MATLLYFYLLKIFNIFNTFRNTIFKITKMATISSLITTVKSWVSSALTKYLPLGGGKMTGAIEREGTSIQWRDILNNSFKDKCGLYQSTYSGYMPMLNMMTTDGRVGIGTYQNYLALTYFLNTNDTNSPNSYMHMGSNGVNINGKTVVCVESWRSGYNWYRKYSDGFLEQGGTFGANNGGWTDATFSFPKAFSNTNYNLFVQGNWSDPSASSCLVHARSASSVTVRHANNYYSTMPSYFVAYGT